jgi:hypothetical protein
VNELVSRKIHSNLERLGVDMNSSEMQVFRAILFAARGTDKPVNYDDVVSGLESITNKKYTKAYIYRRLNALAESGFIMVDKIHTPRMYTITETSVAKALDAKRRDKLSKSLTKRQDLTTRLNRLKSVKCQDLALMLYNQLAGDSSVKGSFMIEGVENVRSTIIREFADGAKEGDLVRILGHSSTLADGLGPSGVTELRVMQAGFRGVKVLGLLTPVGQDTFDVDLMAKHLVPLADVFKNAASTGNIQLRISHEPINTYRMLSLNEDKMLLYLTHAKASDVAALVHRKDNPGLLDDALRTFDEIWDNSIDVLEIVKQTAQKKQVA